MQSPGKPERLLAVTVGAGGCCSNAKEVVIPYVDRAAVAADSAEPGGQWADAVVPRGKHVQLFAVLGRGGGGATAVELRAAWRLTTAIGASRVNLGGSMDTHFSLPGDSKRGAPRVRLQSRGAADALFDAHEQLLPRADALVADAARHRCCVDATAAQIDAEALLRYQGAVICLGPDTVQQGSAGSFHTEVEAHALCATAICVFFPAHRAAEVLALSPADQLTPTKVRARCPSTRANARACCARMRLLTCAHMDPRRTAVGRTAPL